MTQAQRNSISFLCGILFLLPPTGARDLRPLTEPILQGLEEAVQEQITTAQKELLKVLEDSLAGDSDRGQAYGEIGQIYHAYGLLEAAEPCYHNATVLDPKAFRWPYYQGLLRHEQGLLPEALAAFRQALERFPSSLTTRFHMGEIYLELHRLSEAETILLQALQVAPDEPSITALLGQIALDQADFPKAVELFEKALEALPQANRLHYPLAQAYRGLDRMEEARSHLALRGTVGARPRDPLLRELEDFKRGERVHLIRGKKAFNAGMYTQAIEAFRAALEARPESTRARINLGTSLHASGDSRGAHEQFSLVLETEPHHETAHLNLADLLLAEKEYAKAIPHLQAVLLKNADHVESQIQLSEAFERLGQWEEATTHYQRALTLDSHREESWRGLVRSQTALGYYSEVLSTLEKALQILPDSGHLNLALARLLAASPDPSIRDGERALTVATAVFEARSTVEPAEAVALALAELGHCEQAAQWIEGALEAGPDSQTEGRLKASLDLYRSGPTCRPPVILKPL